MNKSNKIRKIRKITGLKEIEPIKLSNLIKEELTQEKIEAITYSIWGEGPTFTNSQMGGHGFFDWDLYDLIRTGGYDNHKVRVKNGKIIMITEFNPYRYLGGENVKLTRNDFNEWWKQNNKNGNITDPDSDELPWNSTLINKNGKWYLIDSGDLKEILDNNDGTPEDKKELLLKNPNVGLYDNSKTKNIEIKDPNEFKEKLIDLHNKGYKWISKTDITDESINDVIDFIKKYPHQGTWPIILTLDDPSYDFKSVGWSE